MHRGAQRYTERRKEKRGRREGGCSATARRPKDHADPIILYHREMAQPVRTTLQGLDDQFSHVPRRSQRGTKQDDTWGQGKTAPEGEFAKVFVKRDREPTLRASPPEDFDVIKPACVSGDPGDIVPFLSEGLNRVTKGVLVGQDAHESRPALHRADRRALP